MIETSGENAVIAGDGRHDTRGTYIGQDVPVFCKIFAFQKPPVIFSVLGCTCSGSVLSAQSQMTPL